MAPLDADARPPRSLLWQRRHAFQRPLHVSQPLVRVVCMALSLDSVAGSLMYLVSCALMHRR